MPWRAKSRHCCASSAKLARTSRLLQRGHALTMLRSFKVILNFSTQYHVAHADSFPGFQHVNNITNFPKALGTPAAMPGIL